MTLVLDGADVTGAVPTAPAAPRPSPRRRRLAVAGVGAFAFLLRLPGLGRPGVLVFDELFYAPDAADLLRWGSEHGQPAHPELGKWLIAAGIGAFGFDPTGWRLASVAAGAALCAVVTWAAIRVTGRTSLGVAAGLLVALDGLVHVTSRLALLDVFLALFTTAAYAALLAAWVAQPDRRVARRCWWWAVAALSLGAAVKWSALGFAPLVLVVGWVLVGRLEAPGRPRRRARAVTVGAVLLLPLAAIVVTSLPRQLGPDRVTPAAYAREQAGVARFHRDLRPDNPNAASAWTWMVQTHPANLYRARCPVVVGGPTSAVGPVTECPGSGPTVARIVAGANPVVWLLGLLGFAVALLAALRGGQLAALLVAGVASAWWPWLLSPRASYSFYAVTVVPPLVLAATWAVGALPNRGRRVVVGAAVVLAAVAFGVLWPVWSARPVSTEVHDWLTWWPGWS